MRRQSRSVRGSAAPWVTAVVILTSALSAKEKLDAPRRNLDKMFAPVSEQTFVYHTNSALWMGWDSYGNTGDQTCSGIIPGWVYPGGGYHNYNCRAGYWIIATIGGQFFEGTTGEYVLTRGTEPGPTSQGWANESAYNKEPWISYAEWTIPDASLTVKATRRSWSFAGTTNYYFKIGDPLVDFDFNDFVIEEIVLVNTGTTDIDQLVFGAKADHDCTWNVPFSTFEYTFWTDDITDYDEVTMTTMELDGDDPGIAENDFGIDDPLAEYRGVRVGQTPLSINGKAHDELVATDLTHMWWTGDEDPQTAAARFTMAGLGFTGNDKKGTNPAPADMRYLQAYGPWALAAGDSVTIVTAVLAGAGLENTQNAAKAAKKAYDWGYNLPKPPAAPQIDPDDIVTTEEGFVSITWTYSDDQINAVDPDKGVADFAGFRVYRAAAAPKRTSEDIFAEEGVTADNIGGQDMVGDVSVGAAFSANPAGPYKVIAEGPASEFGSNGTYTYVDEKVAVGLNYWYYVAAYDEAGSDPVHGDVPSLESYYTMCYPLQEVPDGSGGLIPSAPPRVTVSKETLTYEDLSDKATTDVFVAPNPWKAADMETYHGAGAPAGFFVRFYNVKQGQEVKIFDVTGNLVFQSDPLTESGSFDWNLVSRTRQQVATGIYYWKVGNKAGKLAVIR